MLSVIVPVYNTSKYLSECVMSLLNQTYKDLEIILVDDGSTDASGKICDEFSMKYENVNVIHKKNGGLISAWTEGTRKCQGEYVGYVDSDDWVSTDYFEILMKPIQEYNCDIVACGFTVMDRKQKIVYPAECNEGLYSGMKLEKMKNNYYKNFNIQNSRCIKIFRKDIILSQIKKLNYSITLCEDQTATVRAILNAKSIYIVNSFGYYYRIIDESMSHKFNEELLKNYDDVCESIVSAFTENGYMNEYVLANCLESLITLIGFVVFSDDRTCEKVRYLEKLREYDSVRKALYLAPRKKMKKSWLIIYTLYKYRCYRMLCVLAKMKKCFLF